LTILNLTAFEIDLLAGREFSEGFSTDNTAVILSETALKSLGFESPEAALNQKIMEFGELEFTVVGVTKDYHQNSLKASLAPIAFVLAEEQAAYYSVKIDAAEDQAKLQEVLSLLEARWSAFYPEYPFDYFFLDEYFNQQYKSDQQFGTIFGSFAGLAIFVACLGLFGLASFSITQRTKEIGVRKVLGASIPNILALLSKDFLMLILLANIFAWPVTYIAVQKWLENYHYRIDLGPWLFVLPSLLVLLIALLTVSGQTWRAARANPVESLRRE
jgi:putative ABC transport system permease protein